MATTGLDTFDKTLHQTNLWLKQIGEELGVDRQHAYHAARAVLHVLRDRLLPGEAAKLASEMPLLLRGIFYEGYKPDITPLRLRTREDFLDEVDSRYVLDPPPEAEELCRAVFFVLATHVSEGEISKVKRMIPEDVRPLWP